MKKLISLALALVLILSLSTVAFAAEDQDASFTKTYKITNAGTSNPEETFTFTYTADRITDSNANLTVSQMPEIPASTVKFDANTATTDGLEKTVGVALDRVTWPGVGVYYYKVNETAGSTAGVSYDGTDAYLKITVAYDEGTETFYTAFVTLNLADANGDGITDSKIGGFTNEYSAGNLQITKDVTGNMGDQSAYFAVDVTLTGVAGKTYAETYAVSGGSYENNPTSISIGTLTTFYLKHGDTITIKNLPYDVTYAVVEQDYTSEEKGGYQAATYTWSDEDGKKIDSANDTVKITNHKSTTVDTGISMDSMPYILLLAVAAMGLAVLFTRKRMMREF